MTAHAPILRILADKFRNLHDALIDNSLGESKVSVATLGKIANKCKYIKIAINPALLWASLCLMLSNVINLPAVQDGKHMSQSRPAAGYATNSACGWYLVPTAQGGPSKRAQHFSLHIIQDASDTSSSALRKFIRANGSNFKAGAVFPHDWLCTHIDAEEAYVLCTVLAGCCIRNLGLLVGAQFLADIDNHTDVKEFERG